MTLLAIDHTSNLEDGLHTGVEVCAMLGDSDDVAVAGIDHDGVEIELDPEVLSCETSCAGSLIIEDVSHDALAAFDLSTRRLSYCASSGSVVEQSIEMELDPTELSFVGQIEDAQSLGDRSVEVPLAGDPAHHEDAVEEDFDTTSARRSTRPPTAVIQIGKRAMRSFKLRTITRQLATRARSQLKSIVRRSGMPVSPTARNVLLSFSEHDPTKKRDEDDATIALTLASQASNSTLGSSQCPSSITESTCDFPQNPNHHTVLERYRTSTAWDAARKGDYATLHHIFLHEDCSVWTRKDDEGHVPLYYAATSYGKEDGLSFGKYGLESVKLLVDAWPDNVDFPRALVKQCEKKNSVLHEDVLEVLSRSNKVGKWSRRRPRIRKDCSVEIDGVKEVVPISFLEDLGDDGYVEDY